MFKNLFGEISILFSYPKHLFLLSARLTIAYGFTQPALMKLHNISDTATWFESLQIPFASLMSYFVVSIEVTGIIFLVIGLFTRYISLLLSFVMMGAIIFVHAPHGFSVENNGMEIPLYYMLFLFIFASFGGGKYALDNLLFKDGNDE